MFSHGMGFHGVARENWFGPGTGLFDTDVAARRRRLRLLLPAALDAGGHGRLWAPSAALVCG